MVNEKKKNGKKSRKTTKKKAQNKKLQEINKGNQLEELNKFYSVLNFHSHQGGSHHVHDCKVNCPVK